jgi:tetratricopeptide (TPR) repeat protein
MAQIVLGMNTVPRSPSSLCLLAAIALTLVFAAAGAWAQDLESCYKAERAQEGGSYGLAVDYYTRCIDAGGLTTEDLANTYSSRGVAYYHKGDYGQAIVSYDAAIRLNPEFTFAYNNRGVAHYRNAAYDLAVRDYDEAIRLDPGYADAYHNRGLAQYYKGDYDQAIRDYDGATRLNPDFAFAYYSRGIARYHKGDYDQAVRDYDAAIRLDPDFAFAYYTRGIAHYQNAAYDRAIRDYDAAIQLDPELAFAYYSRGKARSKMGHSVQAIQDYGDAVRLNSSIAAAYRDYTETIELKPEDASTYSRLGDEHLDKGELDQAIQAYDEAIALDSPPATQALDIAPAGGSETGQRSLAIHLASVRTKDGAEIEWNNLQRQFPELIGQRGLIIRSVEIEAQGTFFRIMAGPFQVRSRAQDLCDEFKSREQYCMVLRLADAR